MTSNERPVQLAMETESALGRRDAIVDRYERLRMEFDERFALEPARETQSLYRRLLSQRPEDELGAAEESRSQPLSRLVD
jgi:DNA-binding SARP family transcriptional activator